MEKKLEVKNLVVSFRTQAGKVQAVRDISFDLYKGETLAIVGESGSGKSVTATSILRLLDRNGEIEKGKILFKEKEESEPIDLTKLSLKDMQRVRGNRISMIFQEPMTALNPVFTIKRQLCEPFIYHQKMNKKQAKKQALEMVKLVQIANAERVLEDYPHTLSGGMRQRVMIAMALSCKPKLLIADEPTTALDVTVQAQILDLMRALKQEQNTAILFITHDLGVVREMADDVAVMYLGEAVELCDKNTLFGGSRYLHPYTEGLMRSIPSARKRRAKLPCIEGNVPHPLHFPKGCKFASRCRYATPRCLQKLPELAEVETGHFIRCYYPQKYARRTRAHKEKELEKNAD